MTALIIIGIIIFLIWANSGSSSSNTNYSSNSSTKTETYTPTVYNKPKTQVSSPSQTISVSPTKISSNPDLKISLIDGQYRYFENHYVNGKQYSFGFPKENCTDRRVWVGIGKEEIERISYAEAMRRIGSKNYISNQTKYISSSSNSTKPKVGYCSNGLHIHNPPKKLRGDTTKKYCFDCWQNGYR